MLDIAFTIIVIIISLLLCGFVLFTTLHLKKDVSQRVVQLDAIRERIENEAIDANNKLTMSTVSFEDTSNLYLNGPGGEITIDNDVLNYSFLTEMGIDYRNMEVVENQVMCLMPFNKRYDRVYSVIKEQCRSNNYKCVRSDNVILDRGGLLKAILEMILESQLIIAVLNGRNANVFYEIGLAHALGKKVILIAEHKIVQPKRKSSQSDTQGDGVFDLQNRRIILYNSYEQLSQSLNNTLRHIHRV